MSRALLGTMQPCRVLVVHENRGLNPHIEDIARRLALEGYMAFAPDALSPLGGYPGDEDRAGELFGKFDQSKTREDFVAAAAAVRARADFSGKLGVVGFCYGGGVAHMLSIRLPDLAASVPFYGNVPAPEEAAKVRAPLLIHFAAVDERINAAWPAYETALKAADVRFTAHQYPGTQHGFNNDTTPRFDAAAAKLAWDRTLAFLHKHSRAEWLQWVHGVALGADRFCQRALSGLRLHGDTLCVAVDRYTCLWVHIQERVCDGFFTVAAGHAGNGKGVQHDGVLGCKLACSWKGVQA